MRKENVGIYLGHNFVSAAFVRGKELVSFAKFNLTSLEEETQEGLVKEDVLWEALINKSIRDLNCKVDDVFVSVGDREFIFRYFDMPLMKKQELESALSYEIEKYIPFKINELLWNYSVNRIFQQKKMNISFLGIKTNAYKKYKELFSGLEVRVLNLEPSAIALARTVKALKNLKKTINFALLDFSENEGYITFFYNDLPIFNRYLNVSSGEKSSTFDKLIEEIRLSVQYFKREFKEYLLDQLFIICDTDKVELFTSLKNEIDMPSVVFTAEDCLKMKGVELSHLKAYATATSPFIPYRFRPVFHDDRDSLTRSEKVLLGEPSFNMVLPFVIAGAGIVGLLFMISVLAGKISEYQNRVKAQENAAALPSDIKMKAAYELESFLSGKKAKLEDLRKIVGNNVSVYPILEAIPRSLSEGLWLRGFVLEASGQEGIRAQMSGYVFLGNEARENASVDEFIVNLDSSEAIKQAFGDINLRSKERSSFEKYNVLIFDLTLE